MVKFDRVMKASWALFVVFLVVVVAVLA